MVNCGLKRSVILHENLYRFRAGRVMGTATLEVKLAQQLEGLVHEPLFQVFWDVCNVYKSMNMRKCMDILRGMSCARTWLV